MADISDVEQVLVNTVAAILYPAGPTQPSVLPAAAAVSVHRGWPLPTDLDRDLAAGKSHVSVWPRGGTERNITPYGEDWQDVSTVAPTVTAAVQGNQVTIGGTVDPTVTQFVTLQIGPRFVASYAVLPTDTLNSIAGALFTIIAAGYGAASVVGPVITIAGSVPIRAIVGTTGSQLAEVRRQITQLQITSWCPNPAVRDSISKLVEPVLADTVFLTMPDQSAARLKYMMTTLSDNAERDGLYRRDSIYTVEYATTKSDTAFSVTSVGLGNTALDGAFGIAPKVSESYALPASPVNVVLPREAARYKPMTPN